MVDGRRQRGVQTRERLVQGALDVVYRQGIERTSLADVAAEADVPIGTIYYYFKTKDDLVDAIVARYAEGREELLTRLERRRTPQARLKGMLEAFDATRTTVSQYGCPIGTLSSELDKRCGLDASVASQEMLGSMVDWSERQFRLMGRSDARDLAVALISAYEGATMLTHSLRDPDLLHRESRRLAAWIDELAASADAPAAPAA